MKEIIIVQHCQSEHHINEMSGGWTDTPLTNLGKEQANLVGLKIKEIINSSDYTLYSSDLLRAKQTAEIIAEHVNINVIENKGLREINTGIAAGKTKEWARQHRNPQLSDGFDLEYQEFQDGETWREFISRVWECMEKIFQFEENNIILVTHGCTLGYIVAWWMKFNPNMLTTSYFSADPCSISILSKNQYGQRVLRLFNDKSHLGIEK